jgi:hypothetical protein
LHILIYLPPVIVIRIASIPGSRKCTRGGAEERKMGEKNEDGIRGLQEQAILEAEDRKMDIGYALYRDHCARNPPKWRGNMELSIPYDNSGSILSIPRQHLAAKGFWIATVTGRPLAPSTRHRQDPRRVGLSIATRLDPTFSADRIFFSPEALLAALNRSQPGEVYYSEDVVRVAVGLPRVSRAILRELIGAVRRHGVGLIIVSPVHDDGRLVKPLRDCRDSAIIIFDDGGYEYLQREFLLSPEDVLAFTWFEVERVEDPGGSKTTMRYPRIEGRRVWGGTTPHPAQDLFARCQAMAEAYLVERYRDLLRNRVENSERE